MNARFIPTPDTALLHAAVTYPLGVSLPSLTPAITASYDVNGAVGRVFSLLPMDEPFIQPKDVAAVLDISVDMVRRYCQNCKELRAWKGSYRFFTDDPDHMTKLRAVVKLALYSMRSTPAHLRLH